MIRPIAFSGAFTPHQIRERWYDIDLLGIRELSTGFDAGPGDHQRHRPGILCERRMAALDGLAMVAGYEDQRAVVHTELFQFFDERAEVRIRFGQRLAVRRICSPDVGPAAAAHRSGVLQMHTHVHRLPAPQYRQRPEHVLVIVDALAAVGGVKLIAARLKRKVKVAVDGFVRQLIGDVRGEAQWKEGALHERLIGPQEDRARHEDWIWNRRIVIGGPFAAVRVLRDDAVGLAEIGAASHQRLQVRHVHALWREIAEPVNDEENRVLRTGGSRRLRVRQGRHRSEQQRGKPDFHRRPPRPMTAYFAFGRCNERMVIGLLMSMN